MRPRGSLVPPEPDERLAVRRMVGVYDHAGRLDRRSIRWLPSRGSGLLALELPEIAVVDQCDEEVVWGGTLLPHHGHFLIESVGRLWPLVAGAPMHGRSVVFGGLQTAPTRASSEWLEAFGAHQMTLPEKGAVRFTRMIVPELAWRLRSWCCPEIRDIHLHARRRLCVPCSSLPHDVVWLSRSELDGSRRPYDERLLEWLLDEHVSTIHPERLSFARQVGILEASRAVVGVTGSAFHGLLAAERTPECLYLCGNMPKPGYIAQHELLDCEATFAMQCVKAVPVPRGAPEQVVFPAGHRLDIPEVLRALSFTVLPGLLNEPRLAAFADPAAHTRPGRHPQDRLDAAVLRMLLEPDSVEIREQLGAAFETVGLGRCAREQLAIAAYLAENPQQPAAVGKKGSRYS